MYNSNNELLNWKLFKDGDWGAYTNIYTNHFKLLNNYGYKFTKDVDLIEDAVHDLFINLWTNRSSIGTPVSVKHYLYKSLRNAIFRKLKAQNRFVDLNEDDYNFNFEVAFDDNYISREEERILQSKIKKVIQTLPARQQEIIYLRYYENISYEEIAGIMEINVSSAYKLLYKAINNLQEVLKVSKIIILFSFLACRREIYV